MEVTSIKIEKMCREAHTKFAKLALPEFDEIKSKLEYVIVSYNADKNPVGLYEIGQKALEILIDYKKEKPRKISKKLLIGLEEALQEREN